MLNIWRVELPGRWSSGPPGSLLRSASPNIKSNFLISKVVSTWQTTQANYIWILSQFYLGLVVVIDILILLVNVERASSITPFQKLRTAHCATNCPTNLRAEEVASMMRTNFAGSGGLAGGNSNDRRTALSPPHYSDILARRAEHGPGRQVNIVLVETTALLLLLYIRKDFWVKSRSCNAG